MTRTQWRSFLLVLAAALLALLGLPAWSQPDPPGRVGRIGELQGEVSQYDDEAGAWTPALRNRPLTTGDRLSTGRDARVEVRIGSTTLRLGPNAEFEILRLDDEVMRYQVHSGNLAVRIRSREAAAETEVVTREVRLRPLRGGMFRIDRQDDTTFVASWRGELRIVGDDGFDVDTGRRVELWREGPGRVLRHAWTTPLDDAFAAWILREDRNDERNAASRYVPPEMTGYEDLDRYGRWERHPEYGEVWIPVGVQADWVPYRYGRWVWVSPWGWTWVDDAPWGFAPFHYGRWVHWRERWVWWPGAWVARPVYSPALVAWVGGPGISVSVNFGPLLGWVPLAPFEHYHPHYHTSPGYRDRVNPPWPRDGRDRTPRPAPTGPVMYGNQGVPGAVTVVPSNVLTQRQPVPVVNHQVRDESLHRLFRSQPLPATAPPVREVRTRPVLPSTPPPAVAVEPTPPFVRQTPGGVRPTPVPDRAPERPTVRTPERSPERPTERAPERPPERVPDRPTERMAVEPRPPHLPPRSAEPQRPPQAQGEVVEPAPGARRPPRVAPPPSAAPQGPAVAPPTPAPAPTARPPAPPAPAKPPAPPAKEPEHPRDDERRRAPEQRENARERQQVR